MDGWDEVMDHASTTVGAAAAVTDGSVSLEGALVGMVGTEVHPEPLPADEPGLIAVADRMLRELADVRGERQANAAALKIELDTLRGRYAVIDVPLGAREERLVADLSRITALLPLRGKKSRKLAFGVLKYRTLPERLAVTDAKLLREEIATWSPEMSESVLKPVEPKIVHGELVKLWQKTGVVPTGCEVTPEREEFYAET